VARPGAADAPFAAGPIARLEELRVTAAEELFQARLALGEGAALAVVVRGGSGCAWRTTIESFVDVLDPCP
jgi:hypothetical protein